tara:strand:- start:771 stop:4220 length:3450 start_codon:yes stop_codon:yes gene_type:complete
MALISPGVAVTVVDESFYVPGIPGAVPLVVVATSQNKKSGTGTGTATGTLSTNAGEIFLISSQRELTQTFGNPTFYTDASGTPIQGYELNEYGLQAAYSFLGIANRAFVIRANIDTAELTGSADAPGGTPSNGFYWLDLVSTSFGIKEWDEATQSFTVITPKLVTSTDDVSGTAPKSDFGSIGDYAVVATNPFNRLYYKTRSNTWVQVGSASSETADGSWSTAHATVTGTSTNPTVTSADSVNINGNLIGTLGTTVATFAAAINNSAAGVSAAAVNGRLEIYAIPSATGDDSSTTAVVSSIIITEVDGTAFTDVGITPGRYYIPKVFIGQHTEDHGFRTSDTIPRPSGSVWIQQTEPNGGADFALKKYSETAGLFESQATPVYKNHEQAIQQLDRTGGGINLTVNDTYIQVNTGESEWNDSTQDSGELIDYVAFKRSAGVGSTTTITSSKITTKTAAGFSDGDTIRMAETILDTSNTSTTASNQLVTKTVTLGGEDADDFVTAISAAGFANVSANYDTTSKRITLSHALGGNIYFSDVSGTAMDDLGFNSTFANTYGDDLNLASDKIANLYIAPAGDKDDFSSTADQTEANRTFAFVATLWTPVSNLPNSGTTYTPIQSVNQPVKDPADLQNWYNTTVDEVDILIHNGSAWTGYQNVSADARGFNLAGTDPNGPIISASEPTTQSDGTALVDGDLWLDTSDLENYPRLYRYDSSQDDGAEFVLIDNRDQTSQDGILFADFRYHSDGTKDAVNEETLITDLLTSTYLDIDAPDSALYPKGMLGFNLRRSGYNVKAFRNEYFTRTNFPSTVTYPTLPTEKDAWVTASGLKLDGSPFMGRKAQRNMIVQALKATVESTTALREEQREFNLLASPSYPELISNLETLNADRKDTAFVLGDSPFRLAPTSTEVTNWANNTAGAADNGEDGLLTTDSFTGVYYPPGLTTDLTGSSVAVPSSHMMMRTIAYNDQVAFPWFAPAGIRRGAIDNASSVGFINGEGEFETTAVSEGLRDALYSVNINPISFVTGAGLVAFGQKTRQLTASALDRINVARLVAFTRLQLDKIARPFIFEPNDVLTRNEIRQSIESFLLELTAQRALFDFAVVCDESNNTPGRIDRNELYVDVAIEPVKAVEFIFIPIRLKNTGEIAALGL